MAKLIGLFTIANEPTLRYTPNGKAVINLSLPANYGKKDDSGKQPTQWYDVSLWDKRAEALAPYLVKGKQAEFTIRDIHIETYQGKNGEGHKLVGIVDDIVLARDNVAHGTTAPNNQQPAQVAPQAPQDDDFSDSIPFMRIADKSLYMI